MMRTAAYTRYSTELQRSASIEDQLRNIRTRCKQEGWEDPVEYSDAAISGARLDRPGFRALLADATDRRFDVLLIDDLSRLSRDKDETGKAIKRLTFCGVRVVGVSDGTDTARDGHELDTGIRAVIGEYYLRDLAKKTHRGLTGRALAGASAGGLPYGYRVAGTGQRVINDDQAAIVLRIFSEYLSGRSPREITSALNRERIPTARAGQSWCKSAIHGDVRRGIGILANPIYAGIQIWNRSRWVKHPDTGRRIRKERPRSEWISSVHPELAIIDSATWEAAQTRLMSRRNETDPASGNGRRGGVARYLLSGILRCGVCGGPIVVINRYCYGCATHKERGDTICNSRVLINRKRAEAAFLAGLKLELLTESAIGCYERAVAAELKRLAHNVDDLKSRLAQTEQTHANIVMALRAGIITPTTRQELETAEAERQAARAALESARTSHPTKVIPDARERWHRVVADLENAGESAKVRDALYGLIGDRAIVREENGQIYAEIAAPGECVDLVGSGGRI